MRLHRFYTAEKIGDTHEIQIHSAQLANQLRRVFRLKTGDSIVLFDGSGHDYECAIDGFGENTIISTDSVITLSVIERRPSRFMPPRDIYLCAAIVKKDTFEWMAEKATELGVTHIVPLLAERSEKKSLNEERLRKIAIEASEQSGRGATPMINQVMGVGDAVEFLKKINPKVNLLAFHTEGEAYRAQKGTGNEPIAVFIGPEGGWSPHELDMFHRSGVAVSCLGPQILRAETAVIAFLSLLVFAK